MSGFGTIESTGNSANRASLMSITPEDYGAVGDGTTDDSTAINLAIQTAYTLGKKLQFGPTTYYCASRILLNCPVVLQGNRTVFKFRNGVDGLYIAYQGGPVAGGGSRALVADIRIISNSGVPVWGASQGAVAQLTCYKPVAGYSGFIYECTTSGTSGTIEPVWPTTAGATIAANGGTAVFTCRYVAGIKILANSVLIQRCTVSAFPGDGLAIPADSGNGDNGNLCGVYDSQFDSCLGYGANPKGPDANWCYFEKCNFSSNGLGGAFDQSALGCVWSACHAEANTGYAFDMYDAVLTLSSCAHFESCYLEGGQTARVAASGMWRCGLRVCRPHFNAHQPNGECGYVLAAHHVARCSHYRRHSHQR